MTLLISLLLSSAYANIDPKCQSLADGGAPADYSEVAQNDFLLNYVSLASSFSAVHSPVPFQPGHGMVGVELAGVPPLGCDRRLVLSYTKTEDTNKTPVIPRPRVLVALPKVGPLVPYVGMAYLPPITLLGTRNVIVSGELGAGSAMESGLQLGGRFHYTVQKTVGEIAEPFVDGDPAYLDLYLGSTFGLDLSAGWDLGKITPYLSVGVLDVSTFFYIGDDNYIGNNYSPYFGPAISAGADGRIKRLSWGAEFYTAPKNLNTGDLAALEGDAAAAFAPARIFTGRARVGLAF